MITIINIQILHDDMNEETIFKTIESDELTSATSKAIIFLQEHQQKEMVV